MKPALIVIDMLNDYWAGQDAARRNALVSAINDLAAIMRAWSHPVIWVRQEFEPDLSDAFPEMRRKEIYVTIKGTEGCQLLPGLAVAPSDPIVVKKRYSAFFGTGLDELLRRLAPDALILAGINTHACIRTTAIDAYQRDWPVILALDCIDSYDREHHEVSLRYMRDKIAAVRTNLEICTQMESEGSL
jgi:nicotinamidase-related amidase